MTILAHRNVPGRLAASASALYARNLLAFLTPLIDDGELRFDWDDEILAATVLTRDGGGGAPPLPFPAVRRGGRKRLMADSGTTVAAEAAAGVAAMAAPEIDPFVFRLAIFVLAIFVGYYVVWSVTPALHTPLMSVTNAVSSVIVVGALLAVGVEAAGTAGTAAKVLGFIALVLASVNIFGGFLVTQRMLAMYRRQDRTDTRR